MRLDAAEAIANALVGIVVSWAATWAVLGFTPAQSVGVTALFFGLSTTRQFLLRRLFRRWG